MERNFQNLFRLINDNKASDAWRRRHCDKGDFRLQSEIIVIYFFFPGRKEIHVLHFISLCALKIVVELPGVTGEFPKVGKQI